MKKVTVTGGGRSDTFNVSDAQAQKMERELFGNGLGAVTTDRGTVAVDYSQVVRMDVR